VQDVISSIAAEGFVAPGFEPVRDELDRVLRERRGWSGSLAAYVDGVRVVDLWGGPDWREDSVVFLYSATKGLSGLCIALLVERGLLDLDAPVARYWPEFAAAGKAAISVRQLLSHQAGLVTVDGGATLAELLDHDTIARKLAAQRPFWEPGTRHGYHPVTLGPLMDELVRRVAGMPLATFLAGEVTRPLGSDWDVFLGFPESEESRLVPILPPPPIPEEVLEQATQHLAEAPGVDAGVVPSDLGIDDLPLSRPLRAVGVASASGVGNARGLARLYAASISHVDGHRLLSPETVSIVSETQVSGLDAIIGGETSFGIVFETPWPGRIDMAGGGSFGHDGFGGSLGYASPRHGLAFGFTTNQVHECRGCDPATAQLTRAILRCPGLE
jgi:CubicO group peptidase (beta-lactamase class C family)